MVRLVHKYRGRKKEPVMRSSFLKGSHAQKMESQSVQVSCIFKVLLAYLRRFIFPQGHHGWLHWFNHPIPDGGRPNTDVWPDVSSYSPSELFPAPGLKTKSGEQTFLFSSRNPQTVRRYVSSHRLYLPET